MTQPENFTAAQASDPATPGQVLADIAALRPDLRVAVASNPSTYPGLIEWLKGLGEPAVDAAIAARSTVQPTQQMPVLPPAAPPGAQVPPAPAWAQGATQVPPQAPFGAPAPMPPGGLPPQGMPPQGMPPQGMPPQGMPPQGMPPQGMAPQGMPPQGMPPQGMAPAGGLQYGQPPKKSNAGLVIALVILGVLVVLGVGGFFLVKALVDKGNDVVDDVSDRISSQPTDEATEGTDALTPPGDDPALDALWVACAAQDWQACDDLYDQATPGTDYFEFADTCGGAWTSGTRTYCVEAMDPGSDTDTDTGTDATDTSAADTLYYDALKAACGAEDWDACEELWDQSPIDSEYETFADTCGGRIASGHTCVTDLGDGTYPPRLAYGDSPGLDALQDACTAGDAEACQSLFMHSPTGSEYETFAQSKL